MKRYVVVWIECDDEQDAEQVEVAIVDAAERIARGREVQNRIQDDQP